MKKSELKPLIKAVLKEMMVKPSLNESSGTLDDYEIEFDNVVVPGIVNEGENVIVTISLDYEVTPGSPARGMSGPPEKSSPAEGAEVNIEDWDFSSITVTPAQGEPREIDFKSVTKEQFTLLKKAVNNYIALNEGRIEEQILEKLGGNIDDEEGFHPGSEY